MQLAFHVFLFIPLYFVWNFWIKWLSLTFLIIGSSDLTFSSTAIFISDILCPGRLKCSPVALSSFSFFTYPLCSLLLRARVLSVSPIYCFRHFSHEMQYITFLVWQFTALSISCVKLVAVAFTIFPSCTYGQVRQL